MPVEARLVNIACACAKHSIDQAFHMNRMLKHSIDLIVFQQPTSMQEGAKQADADQKDLLMVFTCHAFAILASHKLAQAMLLVE